MTIICEKINRFLKSHGAEHMIGFVIHPYLFLIFMAVCGGFVVFTARVFGAVTMGGMMLCFLAGAFLPIGMLLVSNESDNDGMLKDLRNLFELLKIQIHAGVYIIDALENCCAFIRSKRLKNSIKRLLNEIYLSRNITEALEDFNASFRNKHVDMLVIILKQAMESGYSVNNLDSAFEQILDVEKAIHIKMENAVERNVQVLQVLFMAGMIAMAVYCSIVEFKSLFEIF